MTVTITQGKIARISRIVPEFRRVQEKPIKIFKSAWPESILAKSQILKLNTRATQETASINIKNGAIAKGAPEGKKRSARYHWCFTAAK